MVGEYGPWFLRVCSRSLENTVGKGQIARNEQFLLSLQSFLLVWRTICHFHQFRNCRLQTVSIWKSLKFVVWEKVQSVFHYFEQVYFNTKSNKSCKVLSQISLCGLRRPVLDNNLRKCPIVLFRLLQALQSRSKNIKLLDTVSSHRQP